MFVKQAMRTRAEKALARYNRIKSKWNFFAEAITFGSFMCSSLFCCLVFGIQRETNNDIFTCDKAKRTPKFCKYKASDDTFCCLMYYFFWKSQTKGLLPSPTEDLALVDFPETFFSAPPDWRFIHWDFKQLLSHLRRCLPLFLSKKLVKMELLNRLQFDMHFRLNHS